MNVIAVIILIMSWLAAMVLLGVLVPAGHVHFIVGLFGAAMVGTISGILIVMRD